MFNFHSFILCFISFISDDSSIFIHSSFVLSVQFQPTVQFSFSHSLFHHFHFSHLFNFHSLILCFITFISTNCSIFIPSFIVSAVPFQVTVQFSFSHSLFHQFYFCHPFNFHFLVFCFISTISTKYSIFILSFFVSSVLFLRTVQYSFSHYLFHQFHIR